MELERVDSRVGGSWQVNGRRAQELPIPSHKTRGPYSSLVSQHFGQPQQLEDLRPGLGMGKVMVTRGYLGEHSTLAAGIIWEMSCRTGHGIKYP